MRWIGARSAAIAQRAARRRVHRPAPRSSRPSARDGWRRRAATRDGGRARFTTRTRGASRVDVREQASSVPVGFAVAVLVALVPFSLSCSGRRRRFSTRSGSPSRHDVVPTTPPASTRSTSSTFWTAIGAPIVVLCRRLFAWASRGIAVCCIACFGRWALGPSAATAVERCHRARRARRGAACASTRSCTTRSAT